MLNLQIHRFILPISIAAVLLLLLILLREFLFRSWMPWVKRSNHPFPKMAVDLIRTPSLFWCVAIALYFSLDFAQLPAQPSQQFARIIYITLVLSISTVLSNIAAAALKNYVRVSSGLMIGLVKCAIMTLGALIALSVLGISIAPILTALGVGGLAVALALKDTLENIFAGIYLISEGALRVGDYLKLESGVEGSVLDFGWRTTRLKTLQNNIVLIPNSKLAQSIITNFNLEEKKQVVSVAFNLAPKADLNQVESILVDVAKKASEDVVGILAVPEPTAKLSGFNTDGSLGFSLSFWVRDYKEQFFAISELRRRGYTALKESGVPFPQQVIFSASEVTQI